MTYLATFRNMEHSHIPIEGLVEEVKHHFDESENISPYLPYGKEGPKYQ